MPESLEERMARFANMRGNPKPVPKVFTMPVEVEPVKVKSNLMKMLDEVDLKFSKDKRVR